MPARPRRRQHEEILWQWIRVDSVSLSVSMYRHRRRGVPITLECTSHLRVRGTAGEPLRDVRSFEVSVYRQDEDRLSPMNSSAIGAITQVRPHVGGGIWIPTEHYEHIWAMANAGTLRYCSLAFTQPKRGSALVVNASFSNENECEDEDPAESLAATGLGG